MLSVDEALERVLAVSRARSAREIAARDALGLVLAEDVRSDIDSPPHDKSIVDGYAVTSSDLSNGACELKILEEVTAGDVPRHAVSPGTAIRIMTGAPLPDGADAVVMVEQAEVLGTTGSDGGAGASLGQVRLSPPRFSAGQNIMRRATSMAAGDVVLRAGHVLRPIELGVLAEVGRTQVQAVPRPRVAVLATGNELVPPEVRPGAGHIRNSNSPMLVAAARAAGAESFDLGIARDQFDNLQASIAEGLEADVLVLSGGVSAGVLDLVPNVLKSLGVEQVFHKISIKPGKPLWFGVLRREGETNESGADARGNTLVFGLPGNPVSSLVGFELFVRPAIARLAGREFAAEYVSARLAAEFTHRGDRPTYHPAELKADAEHAVATPLRWKGSADLGTLSAANALLVFTAGDYTLAAGNKVRAMRLA
jgi:molybdopterin molybdotransferase